jgi:hypothetical protein
VQPLQWIRALLPRIRLNPGAPAFAKSARVAHITLFHGGSRVSALSLPLAAQSSLP